MLHVILANFSLLVTSICFNNLFINVIVELTMQTDDSGLASYVAEQIDRSLSWKVSSCMDFYRFQTWTVILQRWYTLIKYYWPFRQDVKWLQTITSLPILLKGVLTAEDGKQISPSFPHPPILNCNEWFNENIHLACNLIYGSPNLLPSSLSQFFFFIAARLAVQNGAAGIIVSNHGARQLDYVPSTIIALEEVHVLLMIMTYFWCILAISRKFTGFLSCQPVNFPFHQVQETFAMCILLIFSWIEVKVTLYTFCHHVYPYIT